MNPSRERTLLTGTEFTDRVMTAISLAPMPTPTRTFVAAVRARALRDAVTALLVAWHLGTVRGWHVAPRVRARSFALVLAVTSVLMTGGLAAAAAVHSVVPQRDDHNPVTAPSGSGVDELGPARNGRAGTDEPAQTDDTEQTPRLSNKPDATDHAGDGSAFDQPSVADDGDDAGDHPDEAADDDGDHDPEDGYESGAGYGPDETDDPDDDADEGDENDEPDDHDDAPWDESDEADETDEPDGHDESDGDDGRDGSSGGDE